MGRYTGPKARINRRLDFQVYENAGAVRASERKAYPPGQANRRKKLSNYGTALHEKQKIKHYYGLRERQLRKYFAKARRMKGNTGDHLLVQCERRLDNVVRRAGFTVTRLQARQAVAHGHFQVNGRTVDIASFQVSAGDVVSVKNRPNLKEMYAQLVTQSQSYDCAWISTDKDELKAVVTTVPTAADVSLPVNSGVVVAFLAR
ncbi:MAG: 30S ribosomal protein S4 [Planctomycetota bacterium]|nr:MAG: 30S ribosomal protein S4 [Planctomycetota bacterium]